MILLCFLQSKEPCNPVELDLQNWIRSQSDQITTTVDDQAKKCVPRGSGNTTSSLQGVDATTEILRFGNKFYAYVTPFILCVGLLGNGASLKVFKSPLMNRFSCTRYLIALSASNIMVLLTYVLLDWLNDGLKYWPGRHRYVTVVLTVFPCDLNQI